MCVFISNRHAYAQVIDDTRAATVCSVSTLSKELREQVKGKPMTEVAAIVGKAAAEKAVAAGVKEIVFDRSGYKYGKRLKALCDAARAGGLAF
jgi:large subunit ribosomal protein L18